MRALLWVGLALLGCKDFADLRADGRCGNGVIEPVAGEDCDTYAPGDLVCGEPGNDAACRFVCETSAACPPGWGCGLDGVCRAPSGQFEAPAVLALTGTDLRVGDVDGDGRDDLIGAANGRLTVAFGDAGGQFSSRTSVRVGSPLAPAAVGDVDGDGHDDIGLSLIGDVQVFLGSERRAVGPAPSAVLEVSGASEAVRLHPVLALGVLVNRPVLLQQDVGALTVIGGALEADEVLAVIPPDGRPVDHLGSWVTDAGESLVALAYEGDTAVYLIEVACQQSSMLDSAQFGGALPARCTLSLRQTLALPQGGAVSTAGTFVWDETGDGTPELLVPTINGQGRRSVSTARSTDGVFGDLQVLARVDVVNSCGTCRAEAHGLRLTADLNLDGRDDLLSLSGLHLNLRRNLFTGVRAQPPWIDVAVGDFNYDGLPDFVARNTTAVTVFLNTGSAFNAAAIEAPAPVTAMATGDFDGDLHTDLALIENGDTLVVLFSDALGVPRERVVQGRFPNLSELVVGNLGATNEIDDLVAITRTPDPWLILLQGDASRRLRAASGQSGPAGPQAIGAFEAGGGALAVRSTQRLAGDTSTVAWTLFRGEGPMGGALGEGAPIDLGADCATDPAHSVLLQAGDVDGDGLDEVVFTETRNSANPVAAPPPWGLYVADLDGEITCRAVGSLAAVPMPTALLVQDLDGDGDLDVLTTVAPVNTGDADAAGTVIWRGRGDGTFSAPALALGPTPDEAEHHAVLELDGDPEGELVVVGNGAVRVADIEAGGLGAWSALFDFGQTPFTARRVDADADGLDDLVVGTISEVWLWRQRPCSAARQAAGVCQRTIP